MTLITVPRITSVIAAFILGAVTFYTGEPNDLQWWTVALPSALWVIGPAVAPCQAADGVLQRCDNSDCPSFRYRSRPTKENPSVPEIARLYPLVPLAGSDVAGQFKAADATDRPAARDAFPRGNADLCQQRSTGRLASRYPLTIDLHDEQITTGRLPSAKVSRDRLDPLFGMHLVVPRVADLTPNGVLIFDMRCALALQPVDLALQPRLSHQPAVTRCDRLGLPLSHVTIFVAQVSPGLVGAARASGVGRGQADDRP